MRSKRLKRRPKRSTLIKSYPHKQPYYFDIFSALRNTYAIQLNIYILVFVIVAFVTNTFFVHYEHLSLKPPGKMITIGNMQIHLWCHGPPTHNLTVLFEPDIIGFHMSFFDLFQQVSKEYRACIYDHHDKGFSSRKNAIQFPQQLLDNLYNTLQQAKESPNFVIVGHGYGSLISTAYTLQHRNHARGLILLDPFPLLLGEDLEEMINDRKLRIKYGSFMCITGTLRLMNALGFDIPEALAEIGSLKIPPLGPYRTLYTTYLNRNEHWDKSRSELDLVKPFVRFIQETKFNLQREMKEKYEILYSMTKILVLDGIPVIVRSDEESIVKSFMGFSSNFTKVQQSDEMIVLEFLKSLHT